MTRIVTILFFSFYIIGCQQKNKSKKDAPDNGTIYISVDESFKPVIQEQIRMYELSYPNTHIIASYKSEADCFKDFFKDSLNRLIIVGRGLQPKEEKYMMDSLGYIPGCNMIASDAVALVLHPNNKDSLFTIETLQNKLQGKEDSNTIFVFDGLNATSTVRFIKENILNNADFDTSVVKATKNNMEVIKYVETHQNAIGFIGISWIGNSEDSAQLQLMKSLKIGYVQCLLCENKPFVKPTQQGMMTRRYPLVRNLFYIIKENHNGLGTGFTSFLKYERGQLIFKRSYLSPVMDFSNRNVQLNEQLPKN